MLIPNLILMLYILPLEAITPDHPIPPMPRRNPKPITRPRVLTLKQRYLLDSSHGGFDLPHRIFEMVLLRELEFVVVRDLGIAEGNGGCGLGFLVELLHALLPLAQPM